MMIRDVMTPWAITANLRDGLHQTWERMRERGIRHMPVMAENDQLAGMISDRDVRRPDDLDADGVPRPFVLDNQTTVEQAMTPAPDRVRDVDPLITAVDLMIRSKYGALPVVDEDNTLVGLISAVDALRVLRDMLETADE